MNRTKTAVSEISPDTAVFLSIHQLFDRYCNYTSTAYNYLYVSPCYTCPIKIPPVSPENQLLTADSASPVLIGSCLARVSHTLHSIMKFALLPHCLNPLMLIYDYC